MVWSPPEVTEALPSSEEPGAPQPHSPAMHRANDSVSFNVSYFAQQITRSYKTRVGFGTAVTLYKQSAGHAVHDSMYYVWRLIRIDLRTVSHNITDADILEGDMYDG